MKRYLYTARIPFTGALSVSFYSDNPNMSEREVYDAAFDEMEDGNPLEGPVETEGGAYFEVGEVQYHIRVVEGNCFHGVLSGVEIDDVEDLEPGEDDAP